MVRHGVGLSAKLCSFFCLHLMKITFLGGGNMANALIGGLRKQGFSAAAIQVIEPLAALNCEVLVLAVKPQQMREAMSPLAGRLQNTLVISIAAGLRLTDLARWLGGHRQLVRCMPNTPALIGAGVTGLYADPAVNREGRDVAEKILRAVGSTLWLQDEAQMDAVTAISGSGPAYVFYFIEALQQAGVELGLDVATARRLAVETFVGAAHLAEQSKEEVALLRQRVTSKGGTTAAALDAFAASGIAQAIVQGAQAAAIRGRELGEEMGKEGKE